MTLRLSVAAIGLLLSGSVFSAVTITAPEEIVILAVNGQEVNSGLFRSSKNSYKVDAGETNLSVRYQEYFEHLNGEHDIVKSGVVTIQTPTLKDGQTYKLAMVDVPKKYEQAKKYAEQPTVALYNSNNELVVQQTGANNEAKPWFATGLLGKVADFTTKPSKPQPQAVYAAAKPSTSQFTTSVAATIPSTGAAQSNDQRLVEVWQKSSKAERQKFMAWLAEQSN
ncbi:DUF2057 domain-containing protein [Acinetobacter seifertii]|uniref:DUF2057 domain-containing protein n=2 Tax=Acinetobacter TaxID=469 RepID=A0A7H2S8A7_9GAMM|nr:MULTISPECIES: DUF2057 family protein [Acinetobacter]ONN54027.1 hypothetical protein AC058_09605 [Acinetobacter genomosp. 33YU]QNX13824.1 DUF2057 domain-containing protein [Acinetobacter seifertii]QNX18205.1 DUF2057 domain-containing protein [Acinetobacter seifertii]QNX24879.1 DUF2057 domain-containing protein [Acinetobacter seifertii]QNX31657.1 DUF2057 domain-containing protein [Acinetobacter seifertii]